MDSVRQETLLFYILKTLVLLLPAALFWWVNSVIQTLPTWSWILLAIVVCLAVPARIWLPSSWNRVGQIGCVLLLTAIGLWLARLTLTFHLGFTLFFLMTIAVILFLGLWLGEMADLTNFGLMLFGLVMAVVFANLGARILLNGQAAAELAEGPLAEILPTATPTISSAETLDVTPTPLPPTATSDPLVTPTVTPTPVPTRPIAGFGYLEWEVDNGEADWVQHTGFGPRINSRAHAYMYDVNGNLVYETWPEYNGKGYRGPEVAYEKPEDTYRILIIGDSFVEAIQVDYEKTFQALLQEQLNAFDTPERRYEVVAMGRTGWGTVHEAAYYQIEGYKYQADLVILLFYVNDVADNYPRFFYPNINNTNFEFVFERDFIQILDTNKQPLPPNNGRKLFNALPDRMRQSGLGEFAIGIIDPAVPVVTPGGPMTRVHPQFYIYVDSPEVEGYAEGWRRTGEALRIMAEGVAFNGGQLAVVPVFLGDDMVENISNWFPEQTEGWVWNPAEPEERLTEILDRYPEAELWPLRPYYNEYANGEEIFKQIYLPEDFHFNELGHVWTADALMAYLVEKGILESRE